MYAINPGGIELGVYDLENHLWIPSDGGNRHWREYLEWAAAGNKAVPYKVAEQKLNPKSTFIGRFKSAWRR